MYYCKKERNHNKKLCKEELLDIKVRDGFLKEDIPQYTQTLETDDGIVMVKTSHHF